MLTKLWGICYDKLVMDKQWAIMWLEEQLTQCKFYGLNVFL
jgi:hypothetical protein